MFLKNLFVQKTTNTADIKIIDQWSVLQGENNGNPTIIRLNTGVKKIVGHPSYSYRIGIAIPLKNPQENGLPSPEENLDFYKIEDEIFNLFQNNNEAFVCVIITTNGMKEFVIYSTTDQDIETKIDSLKSKFSEYDFQNYVQKDKNWDTYKEFNK